MTFSCSLLKWMVEPENWFLDNFLTHAKSSVRHWLPVACYASSDLIRTISWTILIKPIVKCPVNNTLAYCRGKNVMFKFLDWNWISDNKMLFRYSRMISFQLNIFIEYYSKMIRIVIYNLDWSSSRPLGDRLADKRHGFLRKAFYPLADIPRYPTKNSNKMNKRHPLRRHQQLVGGSKMMSLTRLYFC